MPIWAIPAAAELYTFRALDETHGLRFCSAAGVSPCLRKREHKSQRCVVFPPIESHPKHPKLSEMSLPRTVAISELRSCNPDLLS